MKTKKVEISPEVLKLLQNYWWPGNVRELEHVILRCAIFSEGENLTEKDLSFETEDGANGFASFLKRTESASPSISKGDHFLREEKALLWSLFLIELVHRIKNPLVSIKTFTQLLREKFDDVEFRDYFYRVVTEDIGKVDLVLNSLLNYVRVNSPLDKTNTVHDLLEGVLKENEIEIEKKKIKIFRKFEKDLPETTFHDEQLRYIFKSILQYIVSFLPLAGSIGFLTKSSEIQKSLEKSLPREKDEKCIEILIVYTGYRKPVEHFEAVLGISSVQKREPIELELRLVKEIIERNRGVMTFQVNEKKPRTLISLILPMERRKIVSYESTNS